MIANTAIAALGARGGAIDQLKAQQASAAQVPAQQGDSQIEELSSRVGVLESNGQAPTSMGAVPPIDFNQSSPVNQTQQTTTRPMPSNQKGTARPVFNERATDVASQLFNDPQQSLGESAPMFDINNNKYNNQQIT